jgi:hypothetical protein
VTLYERRGAPTPPWQLTYPATVDGLYEAARAKAQAEDDPEVPGVVPTTTAIVELIERLYALERQVAP